MKITHCAVLLAEDGPRANGRLLAFARIVIDRCFVVGDIRVIAGAAPAGAFVAMPSRKVADACPRCGGKNHLRSRYCNACGGRLDEGRATPDDGGRAKLNVDVAHPINAACRELIDRAVLEEYHAELGRSRLPGYVPTYGDWTLERAAPANPIRGRLDRLRPAAVAEPPA